MKVKGIRYSAIYTSVRNKVQLINNAVTYWTKTFWH